VHSCCLYGVNGRSSKESHLTGNKTLISPARSMPLVYLAEFIHQASH
jgi:hypothetical protein